MAVNPLTGCTLDHDDLVGKQLVADGGLYWARCPYCGIQAEARMTQGLTRSENDLVGGLTEAQSKGKYTPRQWAAIERAKRSFEGGYLKS